MSFSGQKVNTLVRPALVNGTSDCAFCLKCLAEINIESLIQTTKYSNVTNLRKNRLGSFFATTSESRKNKAIPKKRMQLRALLLHQFSNQQKSFYSGE
jgi:hypothetical protein